MKIIFQYCLSFTKLLFQQNLQEINKDFKDKNFKLVYLKCLETQNFFIANDKTLESINLLKDR